MPLTSFCDGRVLGERRGDNPSVLALHGWGRDRRDFATALGDIDAVVVDLPGFGASPPPPQPWGAGEYADALAPLLGELGRPVVVVGHSFGGRVAVNLAARHAEAVGALVLSGVPLVRVTDAARPRAPVGFRLLRRLHRAGLVGEARMERARRRHGSADYRAASGVMRQVLVKAVNESYEDVLERITCPVELVWGRHDQAAPLAVAERALAHLAHGHLTVLDGGHDAWFHEPGGLRAAVAKHCP